MHIAGHCFSSFLSKCHVQGLVSGINAARHSDGKSEIILERESSYIGTLIDDLVTKDLREPYRMLTRYDAYFVGASFYLYSLGSLLDQ